MCLVTLEFYGSNIGAVDIRSFLLKLPPNWYFEETCVCSPMHKISFKTSKGNGVIPFIIKNGRCMMLLIVTMKNIRQ